MQLSIESVNKSLIGTFGGRNPLGAERWSGADIPERPADDGVGAGLDGFDIVGCRIGNGVLYKCQGCC